MSGNKRNWLDTVEWVTLISSVLAVLGSVIIKQFILVGVPLAAALSVSIINRRELNKQNQASIDEVSKRLTTVSKDVKSLVGSVKSQPQLQPIYQYNLVLDRDESREILLDALDKAQERLILVCPWVNDRAIDSVVIGKIKSCLNRQIRVEIGYGNLGDIKNGTIVIADKEDWKYSALPALKRLQTEYSSKCKLKLLGTHEKFLVCDDKFAMLGSHNFLTSGNSSSERELGVFTNDADLISKLINRFDTARNLDTKQIVRRKLEAVSTIQNNDIPF